VFFKLDFFRKENRTFNAISGLSQDIQINWKRSLQSQLSIDKNGYCEDKSILVEFRGRFMQKKFIKQHMH